MKTQIRVLVLIMIFSWPVTEGLRMLQAFKQAETAEARMIYALENRDEAIAREELR